MNSEETNALDTKVNIVYCNNLLVKINNYIFYTGIILIVLSIFLLNFGSIVKISKPLGILLPIINKIPKTILHYSIIIGIICSVIYFVMEITKFMPPKYDPWISDIAYKRLSCGNIWFNRHKLFIEYDIGLKLKDGTDFVREISDKSVDYTYYFNSMDINQGIISITPTIKQALPTMASVDKETDSVWNIIPLGEAVNHKLKTVSSIGWMLNDNNKRPEMVDTLPSTSILISGGTGSGKSVLQQAILGHISRFSDHFSFCGIDVKRVEFKAFIGVKGVKKIALSVEEGNEVIQQARDIMYDRFKLMEENNVNNVYKLDANVDYYDFGGHSFQLDEIFSCKVNGEDKVLTMDKIYIEVEKGSKVEIPDMDIA